MFFFLISFGLSDCRISRCPNEAQNAYGKPIEFGWWDGRAHTTDQLTKTPTLALIPVLDLNKTFISLPKWTIKPPRKRSRVDRHSHTSTDSDLSITTHTQDIGTSPLKSVVIEHPTIDHSNTESVMFWQDTPSTNWEGDDWQPAPMISLTYSAQNRIQFTRDHQISSQIETATPHVVLTQQNKSNFSKQTPNQNPTKSPTLRLLNTFRSTSLNLRELLLIKIPIKSVQYAMTLSSVVLTHWMIMLNSITLDLSFYRPPMLSLCGPSAPQLGMTTKLLLSPDRA